MKYITLILICIFLSGAKFIDVILTDESPAKLMWVLDGDTFRAKTTIKNKEIVTKIRVRGIDTPEIRGDCKYERDLAKKAKKFVIKYLKGREIILKNISKGYYHGRHVADVYVDGKSLAETLLENNLAQIYIDHQYDWCKDSISRPRY